MLRYGDQASDANLKLLETLAASEGRPPRRIEELTNAYAIATASDLSAWSGTDIETLTAFTKLQQSATRALILADEGETFLRLFAAVNKDDTLRQKYLVPSVYGINAAILVADQDDDFRLRMALRAEGYGLLMTAAALLAERSDRAELDSFLERHASNEDFMRFKPIQFVTDHGLGVMMHEEPLYENKSYTVEDKGRWQNIFVILKAGMNNEPTDFLNIFFNQTGLEQAIATVAEGYLEKIASGEVDAVADPEAGWVLIYKELQAQLSPEEVGRGLSGFDWPSTSIRHFAGRAVETLDWAVAKDLWGPYVRGEVDARPLPEGLLREGAVDWMVWESVADAIRAEDYEQALTDHPKVAIELLWEANQFSEAASAARDNLPLEQSMAASRDLMVRLDRKCKQTTYLAGGAIRFGGLIIYQFDPH